MRNYKDSDYALNRYSKGIVYKFADGIVEITLEDYLRDNPDKTEEDFAELKAMSDEIYYQQDKRGYAESIPRIRRGERPPASVPLAAET